LFDLLKESEEEERCLLGSGSYNPLSSNPPNHLSSIHKFNFLLGKDKLICLFIIIKVK